MARLTRRVENNILLGVSTGQGDSDPRAVTTRVQEENQFHASRGGVIPDTSNDTGIVVGSPAWFQWLTTAKSFAFSGETGTFTARKEHAQRGSVYWRAYRMRHGVLRRAYLGKSEYLTPERLNQVAHDLAGAERTRQTGVRAPPKGAMKQASLSGIAGIHARALPQAERRIVAELLPSTRAVPRLPPLMTSKWCMPALPANFVRRAHLTSLIRHSDNGYNGDDEDITKAELPSVFVLTAPAGFGKTTVLRCWADEWLQVPHHAVAWVSLDTSDSDPALFWRYVATALDQACPGAGREALAQLDSNGEGNLTNVVAVLVNGIATAPVHLFLALDDYHAITTPAIHESMTLLIARLPAHVHLALASRTHPPLALSRLAMAGRVTILTAEALRFTASEMQEFFAHACTVPLPADVFTTLDTLIAGWAAGLQLAAVALRKGTDRSGNDDHAGVLKSVVQSFVQGDAEVLSAYLLEEIFTQQPPSLQAVLLRTGCLDLVCPSLLAAVMNTSVDTTNTTPGAVPPPDSEDLDQLNCLDESQAILGQLVHDQLLLTPLDQPDTPDTLIVRSLEQRHSYRFQETVVQRKRQFDRTGERNPARPHTWYRYHPLFAEFLRDRLQRTDHMLFREVQRCAAVWHAQQGFFRSAIAYAVAAADIPTAAKLIELHAETIYQHGELITLRHWLEALPNEVISERPLLCLLHANVLGFAGDVPGAAARLEEAMRALGWSGWKEPSGSDAPTRVLAARILAAKAEVIYEQRDRERALTVYRHALRMLPDEEQQHRLEILSLLAQALVGTRRLTECIATSEQVVALSRTHGQLPRLINALYDLGYYRRLEGSLPVAVDCFREALFLAEGREDTFPRPMSLVHMGLGRLFYEWNELEAAKLHLLRALELNNVGSSAGLHVRCYSTLAFICEAQGSLSAAKTQLERIADHCQMTPHRQGLMWAGETSALFWLRRGETAAASAWVQKMGVTTETAGRPEVDDALLMLARLLLATGKAKESLVVLQRVHAGPEKKKYITDVLPVMALQAQAYQALGATAEALTTLASALALAEPGGYIRTFLDEGPMLLPLLRAVGRAAAKHLPRDAGSAPWPSAAYVKQVVTQYSTQDVSRAIASSTLPAVARFSGFDSLFSARERDIVEHLLAGRSNPEIAQALVIARSTLKWHLQHIYAKLNARNRVEAVVQLHRMGVVSAREPGYQ